MADQLSSLQPFDTAFSGNPALAQAFQAALPLLEPHLTTESLKRWARAASGMMSPEPETQAALGELLSAATAVAPMLAPRSFLHWTSLGKRLLLESPAVAAAYFRASPSVLSQIGPTKIGSWVGQAQRLRRDGKTPGALAEEFLRGSSELFRTIPFSEVEKVVDLLALLNAKSPEVATRTFRAVLENFPALAKRERRRSLAIGASLATGDLHTVGLYADVGWGLLARLGDGHRAVLLDTVELLSEASFEHLSSFLQSADQASRSLDAAGLEFLLPLAARVALRSPIAAHELLSNGKDLLLRLSRPELELWFQRGEELLRSHEGAGVSYFRLQSRQSQEAIAAISSVVALGDVREVLRLYCQALMGKNVDILAADDVQQQVSGWVPAEEGNWLGPAIFAPSFMRELPSKETNFEAYKVLCTHQAGHLEFGTYDFAFEGEGAVFGPLRHTLAATSPQERDYFAAFDRLFDLFADRRLAQDLFTIAEDNRIDALLREEYRGIRGPYRRVQEHALNRRPPLLELSLREYFVEVLVRHSLQASSLWRAPKAFARHLTTSAGILRLIASPGTLTEDVAEATIRLYVLLRLVPNVALESVPPDQWIEVDLSEARYDPAEEDLEFLAQTFLGANQSEATPESGDQSSSAGERPYNSPPPVQHRADLRPEVMQTLMRLQRERAESSTEGWQRFEGNLEDWLETLTQQANFTDAWGTLSESEGLDPGMLLKSYLRSLREPDPWSRGLSPLLESIAERDTQVFHYDEWDYRVNAFRPDWCQLFQRTLKEGSQEFYEQTLHRHPALVYAIRKQFEMLRPEAVGRVKRLIDGEDFDLDAVVESVVDKRAGDGLKDKVYWRRNKTERSVAVALLLDMSLSTDEKVERHPALQEGSPDLRESQRSQNGNPNRRIIEVEKEGLVLFIEALEQIGDSYGIYGFSGSGRGDVQFFVVKDLKETLSSRVKGRVDKIVPLQGTRMGPAIRHATSKLVQAEARTKLLILLSDGRPQDRDYGTLPWELEAEQKGRYQPLGPIHDLLGPDGIMTDERDYAVHDTKAALNEARNKNIAPFCISIDKEGHDYLKAMCGDIGYAVVSDIASLPRRLPALYRSLTT